MATSEDEEFCRKAFKAYLQAKHGIRDAELVSEPYGESTPPDISGIEVQSLNRPYGTTMQGSLSQQ